MTKLPVNSMQKTFGFTLIELLLAIAIFSLISLASFTLLDTSITSNDAATARNERLNELNRAFMVMERDFIQLAKRTVRINGEKPIDGFLHIDTEGVFSQAQALAFVRAGYTNPGLLLPRSDLQSVAYQLNEDKIERLSFYFVDNVVGAEPQQRELLSNVETLEFEFFYGSKWQQLAGKKLPKAIAVIVETKDMGEIRRQFLLPDEQEVVANSSGSGNSGNGSGQQGPNQNGGSS